MLSVWFYPTDDLTAYRTEEEFRSYVNQFFFPCAPRAALSRLFELYPNDPAQGSPFGTGNASQFAPMFKRLAAFQGDMMFQAPRRYFLDQRSSKQHAWTYSKWAGVPCHVQIRFIPHTCTFSQ